MAEISPPSAETPSQSRHEALAFGHVSSHHLTDLETKSVTDDTKCPSPTTRLQPSLPTQMAHVASQPCCPPPFLQGTAQDPIFSSPWYHLPRP